MKKLKLISPILAMTAAAAPLTMLATTSCSKFDYTKYCKLLKEDAVDIFRDVICGPECYRQTFDCQQIYEKIQSTMSSYGFSHPIASDKWSKAAHDDFEQFPATKGENNPVKGDYGNIWYDLPATAGWEKVQKVIITAHYDVAFDLPSDKTAREEMIAKIKKDGIKLLIDEETQKIHTEDYASAAGFSDGIGVAFLLSLAKNHKAFPHGPIRLLFTADSLDSTPSYGGGALFLADAQQRLEQGMKPYDTPFIICTDGYTQGEISVSSAGIHQCQFNRALNNAGETAESGLVDLKASIYHGKPHMYEIEVSGLTGAQSGTDAHKNCANAVKILFEAITFNDDGFRIVNFTTNETNTYRIPSQAKAKFVCAPMFDASGNDVTDTYFNNVAESLKEIYENNHPIEKGKIKIEVNGQIVSTESNVWALTNNMSQNICFFGNSVRCGVYVWFDEKREQPKTSGNLCPLNITEDANHQFTLSGSYSIRSASKRQLEYSSSMIHTMLNKLLSMEEKTHVVDVTTPVYENTEETFKVKNQLSEMVASAYRIFRFTPKLVNNHACQEAVNHAYVIENYYKTGRTTVPYITTIGPTIINMESKDEVLYAATLNSCIRAVLFVLQNAANLKE